MASGSNRLAEAGRGVFSGAFFLFKASFRQVWVLSLTGSLAPVLSVALLPPLAAALFPASKGGDPVLIGSIALGLLIFSYCYLGVVARMDAQAHARALGCRQTLTLALARYPAFLGLAAIGLLAYGAPAAVAVAALLYMLGAYAAGIGAIGMMAFTGAAALITGAEPGIHPEPALDALDVISRRLDLLFALAGLSAVISIVFTVYGYFAGLVIVTERLGPLAALRRSFGLVLRNWRRTVRILMLAGIGCAIVWGRTAGAVSEAGDVIARAAVAALFSLVMTFLVAVSLAMLYDLDRRRGSSVTAPPRPPRDDAAFRPETPE